MESTDNCDRSVLHGPDPLHDADVVYGSRMPPDWSPTIHAERDPRRRQVLQDIEEFDGLTEIRTDNGCTLYHLASTDSSLLNRKDAIRYIARLIENLELWQHLARRLSIAGYKAPRELKIHTVRRNIRTMDSGR